jgi:hypothetical protein
MRALEVAEKLMLLYQGTTLQAAEKLAVGKNSLLDRPGLSSNCASPGLSVRGADFQTRENALFPNDRATSPQRALALVRTAPSYPISPCAYC